MKTINLVGAVFKNHDGRLPPTKKQSMKYFWNIFFLHKNFCCYSFATRFFSNLFSYSNIFTLGNHICIFFFISTLQQIKFCNFQKQAKSAMAISCLLGLGWIVGFFLIFNNSNYSEITVVVRWLFILLNAPQVCLHLIISLFLSWLNHLR